jgi:hypothetical protein
MPFGRKKSLMDRAHDYVEQLSDQITETVIPQLESAWEQAVEKAGPAITDAREKATPLIAEGRAIAAEKASVGAALAAEKATEAREKAAPLLAEARATAADKASVGAALAAERASASRDLAAAKVNELRGVEPEPKGGRLKKLLLLGGLLAVVGVVANKLRAKQDDSAHWQSTYVPPAPPASPAPSAPSGSSAPAAAPVTPATTSGDPLTDPLPDETISSEDVVTADAPAAEDVGGGAPGEAISDSVEEPSEATTPDQPAEIIDIDDVPQKK